MLKAWAVILEEDAWSWSNGGGAISVQAVKSAPRWRKVGVPPHCGRGAHRKAPGHSGYTGPSGFFFRKAWRPHTTNHVKQPKSQSFWKWILVFCSNACEVAHRDVKPANVWSECNRSIACVN